MFLFLLLPIVVFWKALTRVYRLFFIIYLIVLANFQDINFNIPSNNENTSTFKLLSLNMGGGSAGKYLKTLITRENPDVLLFQETYLKYIDDVFVSSWNYQCDNGLCIASKYPYKKLGEFSRRIFGGWGNFAVYYELNINGKTLPLMNVHLETPRHILSELIGLSINMRNIENFRENKSLEASMLSTWASSQSNFVMAGDFNMTTNESLYRDYFYSYQNALSIAGLGANYTKYTSWHGVRIDHTLASSNINFERADVMPSLGGDHRAVVTIISLP
jgi:endonuclease/exonuclease/phosphatase (EEP) superfamily protein YafD